MVEGVQRPGAVEEDDFVPFFATGEPAKGEYHCAECGYGIAVFSVLPACPMCAGESWEQSSWSPFKRNLRL